MKLRLVCLNLLLHSFDEHQIINERSVHDFNSVAGSVRYYLHFLLCCMVVEDLKTM